MYQLRPLAAAPENIDLPKCMYIIKPMNRIQDSGLPDVSIQKIKMDPEYAAIEKRQLEVIARLRKIRDTVDGLIKKHGVSLSAPAPTAAPAKSNAPAKPAVGSISKTSSTSVTSISCVLTDVHLPDELVIEANPSRPPLALLMFKNLNPNIRTTSHVHSSCLQKVDPKLASLFSKDASTINTTIRVVWKNVKGSRLTPPNLGSIGVEGESNVARYLSRVLTKSDSVYNYDALSVDDLVLVDGVLESSDSVDIAPDQFLNSLQAYVQRRSSGRTIADFVGYSTLRYLTNQRSQQSMQKSLVDWMNCLTNEIPSLC